MEGVRGMALVEYDRCKIASRQIIPQSRMSPVRVRCGTAEDSTSLA